MKQVEMPFENHADHPAERILINDEQKHQLIALMAQAIRTLLKPQRGGNDEPA